MTAALAREAPRVRAARPGRPRPPLRPARRCSLPARRRLLRPARASTTGPPPPPRSGLGPQSAPRCPPPHAPPVTHPGAGQQQRQQQQPGRHGEDSGLAPGPAGRLRGAVRAGGRAEDGAGAQRLQRRGCRTSADAELTRR